MCNGTLDVVSSQGTECKGKVSEGGLKMRQVVVRELEGMEFRALVLRSHGDEADVVYMDDHQIEYDVPVEELNATVDLKIPQAEIEEIWRKAMDTMAGGYSEDESDDAPLTDCKLGGKYMAADGTMIISHGDEEPAGEQLASTCASPTDDSENEKNEEPANEKNEFDADESLCASDDSDDSQDEQEDRDDRLAVAQTAGKQGLQLRKVGKFDEAEKLLRRSLEIHEYELGEDHPYTVTSRNNLANLLMGQGKLGEAEIEHRRCLASKLAQLGEDDPLVATSHYNLGLALSRRNKLEEAEEELKCALRIQVEELGEESPQAVVTSRSLCRLLLKQGKSGDASSP